MGRLQNQIAIITGGNRGIGAAIVKRLAEEGADVAINYLTDDLEESAREIEKLAKDLGRRSMVVKGDVGDKKQVNAMIENVEKKLGPIDILVNNAGIAPFESFLQVSEETWDRTYRTNVKSIFLTAQAVARGMIKRGHGKIVNVASTASIMVTSPVIPHYISSKAAAYQLTKALAIELGKHNINVNAVGPSTVDTEMTKRMLADPGKYQQEVDANPMKRLGTPKQIADAVIFLSSEEAMQVNGQLLMVDGGLTVKAAQPEDHLD